MSKHEDTEWGDGGEAEIEVASDAGMIVGVRFTADELYALDQEAERSGLPITKFAKQAIMARVAAAAKTRERPMPAASS